MTDFAALDETKLRDACEAVLGVLVDAARGAGWEPSAQAVTLVDATPECDGVYVWPATIGVEAAAKCVAVPQVGVRWLVASCIGAGEVEDDAWWGDRVELLDRVWAVVGGLFAAYTDGTLCGALGLACDDVRLDRVDRFDSGDLFVWSGVVTVTLGV